MDPPDLGLPPWTLRVCLEKRLGGAGEGAWLAVRRRRDRRLGQQGEPAALQRGRS